jgi:hypothetical protein
MTPLTIFAYQPANSEYESVEGLDAETVALKREYEAEVEHKVASDYEHIVWAYGVIWALFAVYGFLLWRRSLRISADVEALGKRIGKG